MTKANRCTSCATQTGVSRTSTTLPWQDAWVGPHVLRPDARRQSRHHLLACRAVLD